MELWIDTFHDSIDYVSLVFNSYFNKDLIEYELENGHVVASLVGVPYEFGGFDAVNGNPRPFRLRGLYLCGLATIQRLRHRGIMSRLIEKINAKAQDLGYDFTFLIPANDGLRKYYSDRGYVDAFRRVTNRYLNNHDFRNELKSIDTNALGEFDDLICSDYRSADADMRNAFINYIMSHEKNGPMISLMHSHEDLRTAIRENEISDGSVLALKDENGEPRGMAFCSVDASMDSVNVRLLVADDVAAHYRLLAEIQKYFPELNIMLNTPETIFGDVRNDAKPYGMLRLLNAQHLVDEVHQLCQGNPEIAKLLRVSGGEEIYRSLRGMSEKEMAETLFRRILPNDSFSRYLDLPALPISISLMLD